MLFKGKLYPIIDIIFYLKDHPEKGDDFGIYGKADEEILNNKCYYVDDYPDVDDHGKEIYPPSVLKQRLHYLYPGQQFADVIDSVVDQKPSATTDEFIQALNYYSEYDDFLDL